METVIVEWFKIVPDWAIVVISVVLIGLVSGIAVMVWIAVKRYADAIGRENKLVILQERVSQLEKDVVTHRTKSLQFQTVTMNARSFINSLNKVIEDKQGDHLNLVQRIVEAIASDIKASGLERHRCGFWLYDEDLDILKLVNGSSGFPDTYISQRTLEINNSIAGRSFRKKQTLNLHDVTNDGDWSSNDSSGTYKALICIPVLEFGVLTIDAREPMDESIQLIGELYASIIDGLFYELLRRIDEDMDDEVEDDISYSQVAATEEIEE